MIVIGYPCIGKSFYARIKGGHDSIDLESSLFIKDENWAQSYCNVAIDLSKQGFDVFVSSHDSVRKALVVSGYKKIFVVYPSLYVKEQWIKRLEQRYSKTHDEKDKRSLERAKSYYEDDIRSLIEDSSNFMGYYEIRGDYDLEDVLSDFYYMSLREGGS